MHESKISLPGVVHGKTVTLAADPGLNDGTNVEVVLISQANGEAWGEGIRRSAGALADDWSEEDDRVLQDIYESRRQSGFRDLPL